MTSLSNTAAILSLICLGLSLYYFLKDDNKKSLLLLFLGAVLLRLVMISLDDFLHNWDERYHALVAKNMIENPLKPMLRIQPILDFDYKAWCCNHIWLHKQPFFLWQMAISMKLFGVNTIALRLPSAIMSAFLVFPVFRIGTIVFSKQIGYIAALLTAFSYYQSELVSGSFGMDHNDMAVCFYVMMSIWAFYEYAQNRENWKWLVLIGLFSGFAILTKWLTGLLVYAGWGMVILYDLIQSRKIEWDIAKQLLSSLFITCLVFVPWQIYTHQVFPDESRHEMAYNTKHVWHAVEGHSGDVFFYLNKLNFHYGYGFYILIIAGMILSFKYLKDKAYISFLTFIMVPFLFFSLIVQTIVAISFRYSEIKRLRQENRTDFVILSSNKENKLHNTSIYKKLDSLVPEDYVVFNCKSMEDVEAMFYSSRNVYSWTMTPEQYNVLKSKGIKIAAFKDHTDQGLPEFMKNDPEVLIIQEELK